MSKLFEKLIQKQLRYFFDKHLSQYLCEQRKGYTTQYALLRLIESWKEIRDKNEAFDTINQALLIATLYAYDIKVTFLKLSKNYLRSRFQSETSKSVDPL